MSRRASADELYEDRMAIASLLAAQIAEGLDRRDPGKITWGAAGDMARIVAALEEAARLVNGGEE